VFSIAIRFCNDYKRLRVKWWRCFRKTSLRILRNAS